MSEEIKPVVTLFESYGSGADEVGRLVAEQLRLPHHEQAFSSEEMEKQAAEREKESTLGRVLRSMGGGAYGALGIQGAAGGVSEMQRDENDLITENTRTVRAYADEGGVIVGRNGALILRDHPAALHVRLDGPLESRIARAAEGSGISAERARRRQKIEDELRADMSLRHYGWDPREIANYDLVINTGQLDLETAATVIELALRAKCRVSAA